MVNSSMITLAMSVLGLIYTFLAILSENPHLYLSITAGTLFLSYYFREVVKYPLLVSQDSQFRAFLLKYCPMLQENFWPTIWCFESRFQTVFASFLRSRLPKLLYKREVLKLSDDGQVYLDWDENESSKYEDPQTRPTVLFLPGLTGDGQADYLRTLVREARSAGFRSVVFNNRGKGGASLLTPRTYCACICTDLVEVIDHIKLKYPDAPLMGTGISLGGIILSHYLVQSGTNCKLVAAMVISIVWNVFEGTKSLEKPILNRMLNNHLAKNLIKGVNEYRDLFKCVTELDWEKILKAETIKQFDTEYTSKIFGFKSINDYYEQSCLCNKLSKIKIPLLAISAADDPFQPSSSIPTNEIKESSHVAVAVTSRGGHIGFLDSIFPRPRSFMDRLFSQYASSVFNNIEELCNITKELRIENIISKLKSKSFEVNSEVEVFETNDLHYQDKEKDLPQEITNSIQKSAHSLLGSD